MTDLLDIHTFHSRHASHTPHPGHAPHTSHTSHSGHTSWHTSHTHTSHCVLHVRIIRDGFLPVLLILIDPFGEVGPDEVRLLLCLLEAGPKLAFVLLLTKDQVERTRGQPLRTFLMHGKRLRSATTLGDWREDDTQRERRVLLGRSLQTTRHRIRIPFLPNPSPRCCDKLVRRTFD